MTLVAIILAVPICSRAEALIGKPDPGSVVLDEIVAVPLTLLPLKAGGLLGWIQAPTLNGGPNAIPWWLVAFTLFRILDITKPWPVGALQGLPGGWGIVMDDLAAGLLAGVVLLTAAILMR